MPGQTRLIPLKLELDLADWERRVDSAAGYLNKKLGGGGGGRPSPTPSQPTTSAREREEARAVESLQRQRGAALVRQWREEQRAAQEVSRARVREEARAAKEVERINRETARQAAEQARFREQMDRRMADARIREANRAGKESANAFLRSMKEMERGSEQTAKSSSSLFDKYLSAAFFGALAARAARAFYDKARDFITGGVQLAADFKNAIKGLVVEATFRGINPEEAERSVKNLRLVRGGIISVAEASTALRNLLATGFGLQQSITLLERFSDSASFGKQAALDYGEAVRSATEGIKNQNSILVDNAGVTKNISVILKERGYQIQDLYDKVKGASAREALYQGLLKETAAQVGNADRLMQGYTGTVAAQEMAERNLQRAVGDFIIQSPAHIEALKIVTEQINGYTDATNDANSETRRFAQDALDAYDKLRVGLIPIAGGFAKFVYMISQGLGVIATAVVGTMLRIVEEVSLGAEKLVVVALNSVIRLINELEAIVEKAGLKGVVGVGGQIEYFQEPQRPNFGSDFFFSETKKAFDEMIAAAKGMHALSVEWHKAVDRINVATADARRRGVTGDEDAGLNRARELAGDVGGGGSTRSKLTPADREQNELLSAMARNLRAPRPTDPALSALISAMAGRFNIPQGLAFAQLHAESRFRPDAVSPQGAIGLGQIMPDTGARFGFTPKELRDPKKNLTAWGQYMTFLYARYGDWDLAVLAYHQGEGTVDKLVKLLTTTAGGRSDVQRAARASGVIGPAGRAYLRDIKRFDYENESGKDIPFNKDLAEGLTKVLTDATPEQFKAAMRQFFTTQHREGIAAVVRAMSARQPIADTGGVLEGPGVLTPRLTSAEAARAAKDEEYFGRYVTKTKEVFSGGRFMEVTTQEREGGRYEELITRQQNQLKELEDQWRDAFLERKHRELDYVSTAELAEARLHELLIENSNEETVANRQRMKVRNEELELTQRLTDLQDESATMGANAGLRQQIALMEELNALRREDLDAIESQIRSQVRLTDASVLHTEQVRARVLSHLAESGDATSAWSDGIIGAYDSITTAVERGISKITGGIKILDSLLASLVNRIISRAFQKFLDALFPSGGGGAAPAFAFAGGGGAGGGASLTSQLTRSFFGGGSGGQAGGAFGVSLPASLRNFFDGGSGVPGAPSVPAALTGSGSNAFAGLSPELRRDLSLMALDDPGLMSAGRGGLSSIFGAGGFGGFARGPLAGMLPFLGVGLGARAGGVLGGVGGGLAGMLGMGLLQGGGLNGILGGQVGNLMGFLGLGGVAGAATLGIGAAVAIIGGLILGRNKQRREDETKRNSYSHELGSAVWEMIRDIKGGADAAQALAQLPALEQRYLDSANALRDSKARKHALLWFNNPPSTGDYQAAKQILLKVADESLEAKARATHQVPEYAEGGYTRGGLIKVKPGERFLPPHEVARLVREGGFIPGFDTGRDSVYMPAPAGSLIANQEQQRAMGARMLPVAAVATPQLPAAGSGGADVGAAITAALAGIGFQVVINETPRADEKEVILNVMSSREGGRVIAQHKQNAKLHGRSG